MTIVNVQNLTYKYAGKKEPAIKNVNLKIEKGEFILISGPSSSGKTTLCRCISGLIPHFYSGGQLKGKVIVSGNEVEKSSHLDLVKHVGFVFQNAETQLFSLSVEKDIAFVLENFGLPRGEIKKRVNWALKITGMTKLRKRAPYDLSGGQKQRTVIASVLAMKPSIMILDEPTSFLDPKTSKKIFEIISKLNKKLNITIILIEQRLDMVSQYVNKIVLMDKGRITHYGTPREVYRKKLVYQLPKVVELYKELNKEKKIHQPLPLTPKEMVAIIKEIVR